MLMANSSLRVFAHRGPTDMRKSFSGLVGLVETELGQQVESGDLFLFFNRRRNRIKVLYFVGDGLAIFCERPLNHIWKAAWSEVTISLAGVSVHRLLSLHDPDWSPDRGRPRADSGRGSRRAARLSPGAARRGAAAGRAPRRPVGRRSAA